MCCSVIQGLTHVGKIVFVQRVLGLVLVIIDVIFKFDKVRSTQFIYLYTCLFVEAFNSFPSSIRS